MTLTGKIALVTGGSRGIGAASALALAAQGVDIAIGARHDDSAVCQVREEIAEFGRRSCFIAADLHTAEGAAHAAGVTHQALGAPDILVHAAGAPALGNILYIQPDVWYAAFDLHVHAVFHLCCAVIPSMQERKEGAIILVSCAAGLRGCLNSGAYSVVKGALPQFCRSLARDYAASNIRVNASPPVLSARAFRTTSRPSRSAITLRTGFLCAAKELRNRWPT